MAVRKILTNREHSAVLRKKSRSIQHIDKQTLALIEDLKDTLNVHPDGIGLAAPQIHVHQRVIVVCLRGDEPEESEPGPPLALINPEIITAADERKDFDGCLSFPGLYGETTRPHYLHVTSLNEKGKPFDKVFEGFDAVVVHHEIDHLEGILFIDRIECMEDLYRIRKNENGEMVKVPLRDFDFSPSLRK
jgi:peptide deformylase